MHRTFNGKGRRPYRPKTVTSNAILTPMWNHRVTIERGETAVDLTFVFTHGPDPRKSVYAHRHAGTNVYTFTRVTMAEILRALDEGPTPNGGLVLNAVEPKDGETKAFPYPITPIEVPRFRAAMTSLIETVKRSRMRPGDRRTYGRDRTEDPWRKLY